jgi:hypothetical protein
LNPDQLAPEALPWRIGRKVGRTIYAQAGSQPSDDDALIGLMDTQELAAAVVEIHNAYVKEGNA